MIKVESLVEIPMLNVKGKVVEVGVTDCLVQHEAEIDGRRKTITQWYAKEIVEEVKDSVILGVDVAKEESITVTSPAKVELGVTKENKSTKGGK